MLVTLSFWVIPFLVMVASLGIFLSIRLDEIYILVLGLGASSEKDREMVLAFDSFSVTFLCVVGLVSTLVLIYSLEYFRASVQEKKFFFIMISFICSMFVLSFSGDLFWAMVGWDGLGITSFYLIIFYQNWKSFNSAMVTFLTNRLGDFFMISTMILVILESGDSKFWGVSTLSPFSVAMGLMLIAGAFTKSAQIPFSGWLPLAMAAPTPVSSLVHSSTLVTAGVYILIRFNSFLVGSAESVVYVVGMITVFFAGVSSVGEYDLKKVIALSTLSHVGLMVVFVGMGSILSAKIHLVIHALFKSILFMVAGAAIHMSANSQDLRCLSSLAFDALVSSTFLVALLSMMGAPFLAGFYSKEIMYDSSFNSSHFLSFLGFLVAVALTCSYSIRLMYYLFYNPTSVLVMSGTESELNLVFTVGAMFSSVVGSLLVGVLIDKEFTESLSYYSVLMKISLFASILFGIGLGTWLAKSFFFLPKWLQTVSHSMWMIYSVGKVSQSSFFFYSHVFMFMMDVKGVIDFVIDRSSLTFNHLSINTLMMVISPLMFICLFFLLWVAVALFMIKVL